MMDGTNSRSKEKTLLSPGIYRGWMASKQRECFVHLCDVQNRQIQGWGCSLTVKHLRGGKEEEERKREEGRKREGREEEEGRKKGREEEEKGHIIGTERRLCQMGEEVTVTGSRISFQVVEIFSI